MLRHCRPQASDGSIPNKAYYLFKNVRIENGGVSYYHPADQLPPGDAPTQCVQALVPLDECNALKVL